MERTLKALDKKSFTFYWRQVEKSVSYLARDTSNKCPLSYEDCFSHYMVDAWKSWLKYDPSRNVQFNTYAINRIRNHRITLLKQSIKDQTTGKLPSPLEDETLNAIVDSNNTSPLMEDELIETIAANETLDSIENLLYDRKDISIQDERAYHMFRMMRYEDKTQADCCKYFGISNSWLSQTFSKKVKKAGTEVLSLTYNKSKRVG